jgi:hypothetical protein
MSLNEEKVPKGLNEEIPKIIDVMTSLELIFMIKREVSKEITQQVFNFLGFVSVTNNAEELSALLKIPKEEAEKLIKLLGARWQHGLVLHTFYSPKTAYFYQVYVEPEAPLKLQLSLSYAEFLLYEVKK